MTLSLTRPAAGAAPGPLGMNVEVRLGDMRVGATVTRVASEEFAIEVDNTLQARSAMIKRVFGGRYSTTVEQISARRVLSTVLARLFR